MLGERVDPSLASASTTTSTTHAAHEAPARSRLVAWTSARMLDKCIRDQWSIDDLDWSRRASDAVARQRRGGRPVLHRHGRASSCSPARCSRSSATRPRIRRSQKIFSTFVADEKRHSAVAAAARRALRRPPLQDLHGEPVARRRFARTSSRVVATRRRPSSRTRTSPPGELILDVALLRSLDDYVADDMSHRAMHLINRDESRHIAIDFHMTEVYCVRRAPRGDAQPAVADRRARARRERARDRRR